MDRDSLAHEYDSAKRRAYYLKTRQLKGRHHGSVQPVSKTKEQLRAERQHHLEGQVDQLNAKLDKLQKALKILVEQAKARSGVKTKKPSDKQTTANEKSVAKKPEKLTASEKAAKAKAAKKAYDKQREVDKPINTQLADEVKSLNGKIKTIEERIAKMRKSGVIGSRIVKTK